MRSERRLKLRAIADRGRGCSTLILFTMSRELSPAACGPAQGLALLKTGDFNNKRPNLSAKVYGPDDLYLISNDYECYRRVVVSVRWVTIQLIAVTNYGCSSSMHQLESVRGLINRHQLVPTTSSSYTLIRPATQACQQG
jgi:hypothetical protein